jgi:hypothetical protein
MSSEQLHESRPVVFHANSVSTSATWVTARPEPPSSIVIVGGRQYDNRSTTSQTSGL